MKRLLKWLGFTLLALLFLLTVAFGVAYYYQAEILAAVNQELKKSINGDIHIGSVDFGIWNEFPAVSITLNDTYIRGPHDIRHHKDFFNAKKVYVNVGLAPLLHKTIVVSSIHVTEGAIFIFRSRSGYTNLDVFKSMEVKDTAKTENPVLLLFNMVRLENVTFSFQDSLKNKSFDSRFLDIKSKISKTDSSGLYSLTGPMKFEGLTFNPSSGSFLKETSATVQLNFEFKPALRELIILPSVLEFSKSVVSLSGIFFFTSPGRFYLKVNSDKLEYNEGISLLPHSLQAKLEKFKIEKPVNVKTTVKGSLAPHSQPDVDVAFQFSQSKVMASGLAVEQVTLDGAFSNHVRRGEPNDDHNSRVILHNVAGIFQSVPMKLDATFYDLQFPRVYLKSNTSINLRDLNPLVNTSLMKFTGGKFNSRFEYIGKLNELLDSTKTKLEGKVLGAMTITDGAIQYVARNQSYENIQVSLNLNQDHVGIKNISCTVNKSRISIQGDSYGFVPFFMQPEKKGFVKIKVYSPALDLSSFLAKRSNKRSSSRQKAVKKKSISHMIDLLYEKVELDLAVLVDQLSYQRLQGSKMNGSFVLANDKLEAKNFTMNLAGGAIALSATIANLQNPVNPLFVTGTVRNADIRKFFYSFDNFGLASPTYENLEGKINMYVRLRAATDDDFTILTRRMAGDVQFSIKRGRLRNFEPLQNMSNFLFKNRDFTNVAFGEIKSRLTFHGTEIEISKMEIESSVIRLFVEGRYSVKDSMNLEVQVPLSNLKRRDKTYKPENVGVDAKVGPSVFLHVYRDPQGKTVIAYDPFKKHVRKKPRKDGGSKKIKS